jgi:hypothetical protein
MRSENERDPGAPIHSHNKRLENRVSVL